MQRLILTALLLAGGVAPGCAPTAYPAAVAKLNWFAYEDYQLLMDVEPDLTGLPFRTVETREKRVGRRGTTLLLYLTVAPAGLFYVDHNMKNWWTVRDLDPGTYTVVDGRSGRTVGEVDTSRPYGRLR